MLAPLRGQAGGSRTWHCSYSQILTACLSCRHRLSDPHSPRLLTPAAISPWPWRLPVWKPRHLDPSCEPNSPSQAHRGHALFVFTGKYPRLPAEDPTSSRGKTEAAPWDSNSLPLGPPPPSPAAPFLWVPKPLPGPPPSRSGTAGRRAQSQEPPSHLPLRGR